MPSSNKPINVLYHSFSTFELVTLRAEASSQRVITDNQHSRQPAPTPSFVCGAWAHQPTCDSGTDSTVRRHVAFSLRRTSPVDSGLRFVRNCRLPHNLWLCSALVRNLKDRSGYAH